MPWLGPGLWHFHRFFLFSELGSEVRWDQVEASSGGSMLSRGFYPFKRRLARSAKASGEVSSQGEQEAGAHMGPSPSWVWFFCFSFFLFFFFKDKIVKNHGCLPSLPLWALGQKGGDTLLFGL